LAALSARAQQREGVRLIGITREIERAIVAFAKIRTPIVLLDVTMGQIVL
jgi:hypothetical protein